MEIVRIFIVVALITKELFEQAENEVLGILHFSDNN